MFLTLGLSFMYSLKHWWKFPTINFLKRNLVFKILWKEGFDNITNGDIDVFCCFYKSGAQNPRRSNSLEKFNKFRRCTKFILSTPTVNEALLDDKLR